MGENTKALGQRLAQARRTAGLTQQELCQKAGLSYSTLAKIERGAIRAPSVFTIGAIAKATGTAIEELLGVSPPSTHTNSKKTSKTGVKFVYFDLNGTLVHGYEKGFTKLSNLSGLPIDTIEALYWHYDDDVSDGHMSMAEYDKAMAKRLGLDNFNWSDVYLDVVEPMPGAAELVEWTAEHYNIGLLSGTMPGLIDGLAKEGKLSLSKFSQVIDSSKVKMLKASSDIFKLAGERSGYQPNEILLVDDEKTSLIQAGKLDWQTSRFNPYDPAESIERIKRHLEF